jgi:DNA-binding HxlR family transcriptional regulator
MLKTLEGKENNMNRAEQIQRELEDTDFNYTLSRINGKFKIIVLYCLAEYGTVRFNEMKKYIPYISFKMLSTTLKELEADHLVLRKEYPQIPPKVEYSLTERGNSLLPILDNLCKWGKVNREEE